MDQVQSPGESNVTDNRTDRQNVSQLSPLSKPAKPGQPYLDTQEKTKGPDAAGVTSDMTDTDDKEESNNTASNNAVTTSNTPTTSNGMAESNSKATTSNKDSSIQPQDLRSQKTNKKEQEHWKREDRQFLKISLSLYLMFLCTTLPFAVVNLADSKVQYPLVHHVTILLSMSLAPANTLVCLLRHRAIRRYVFRDRF